MLNPQHFPHAMNLKLTIHKLSPQFSDGHYNSTRCQGASVQGVIKMKYVLGSLPVLSKKGFLIDNKKWHGKVVYFISLAAHPINQEDTFFVFLCHVGLK